MAQVKGARWLRLCVAFLFLPTVVIMGDVLGMATIGASTSYGYPTPSYPGANIFLPLVMRALPTPTPVACNTTWQWLQNHSFESGFDHWTLAGYPERTNVDATDGDYSVILAGYNNADDAVLQSVTVPSWAETAALYFDWAMASQDSPSTQTDGLLVAVYQPSPAAILGSGWIFNDSPREIWYTARLRINDIASYRGKSITVVLNGNNNASLPTLWVIDNVRFVFGCGSSIAAADASVGDLAPGSSEEAVRAIERLAKPVAAPGETIRQTLGDLPN